MFKLNWMRWTQNTRSKPFCVLRTQQPIQMKLMWYSDELLCSFKDIFTVEYVRHITRCYGEYVWWTYDRSRYAANRNGSVWSECRNGLRWAWNMWTDRQPLIDKIIIIMHWKRSIRVGFVFALIINNVNAHSAHAAAAACVWKASEKRNSKLLTFSAAT